MPGEARLARRQRLKAMDLGAGWDETIASPEPSPLHAARIRCVLEVLAGSRASRVADLGCGSGALVRHLLGMKQFERIVAMDTSQAALTALERGLSQETRRSGRLVLVNGSFTEPHAPLRDVQAVAMLETIEHVAAQRLSTVERAVFVACRPQRVVMTTPNQEYNVLFGMAPGQLREPGHCFEWSRARFQAWATGVARRNGYDVSFTGIGEADPHLGSPTQMADFVLQPRQMPPS